MFREYKTYVSVSNKVWNLIVVPLAAIGLMNLLGIVGVNPGYGALMLIMGEILLDSFSFSGLCIKHGSATNFIQSSNRGKKYIQNLVVEDYIIRVIKLVVIFGLGSITNIMVGLFDINVVMFFGVVLLLQVLGVFTERHFSLFQATMIVGVIFSGIGSGFSALYQNFTLTKSIITTVASLVLAAICIVFSIFYIIRAYSLSFSDEK